MARRKPRPTVREENERALLEAAEWVFAEQGFAGVGSSRVDLQACKLEYSIVSPK